jgi:hypothetical protein
VPSHSAIADGMARRSASGIPAHLSASVSGQPVRTAAALFREVVVCLVQPQRGHGLIPSDNLARPDALQFFSTTCYVRPASLVTAMSVRR